MLEAKFRAVAGRRHVDNPLSVDLALTQGLAPVWAALQVIAN